MDLYIYVCVCVNTNKYHISTNHILEEEREIIWSVAERTHSGLIAESYPTHIANTLHSERPVFSLLHFHYLPTCFLKLSHLKVQTPFPWMYASSCCFCFISYFVALRRVSNHCKRVCNIPMIRIYETYIECS